MIPRYSMPEMAAVFSDETRFGLWLEIELLAVEALSELGVVPPEHARACRARAPETDAELRAPGGRARSGHQSRRGRFRRRRPGIASARPRDRGSTTASRPRT